MNVRSESTTLHMKVTEAELVGKTYKSLIHTLFEDKILKKMVMRTSRKLCNPASIICFQTIQYLCRYKNYNTSKILTILKPQNIKYNAQCSFRHYFIIHSFFVALIYKISFTSKTLIYRKGEMYPWICILRGETLIESLCESMYTT